MVSPKKKKKEEDNYNNERFFFFWERMREMIWTLILLVKKNIQFHRVNESFIKKKIYNYCFLCLCWPGSGVSEMTNCSTFLFFYLTRLSWVLSFHLYQLWFLMGSLHILVILDLRPVLWPHVSWFLSWVLLYIWWIFKLKTVRGLLINQEFGLGQTITLINWEKS